MLSDKEFFKLSARWAGGKSIDAARKWWDAFYEVILRELFATGSCRIPYMGTFRVVEKAETHVTEKDNNGKVVVYRVPARLKPVLEVSDEFINDASMQGVTKSYRKRLRKNALSERDWKRQLRAESMGLTGENPRKKEIEAAKTEFTKMLKERKYKDKLEKDEQE